MTASVVLLDVDFTILHPARVFTGEGYAELAATFGVTLDAGRYEQARLDALARVFGQRRALDHRGEEHARFTELVVEGMGGSGERGRAVAQAAGDAWNDPANFALYDDVHPVVEQLTAAASWSGSCRTPTASSTRSSGTSSCPSLHAVVARARAHEALPDDLRRRRSSGPGPRPGTG